MPVMICALIASLLWDALDAMRLFAKSILILAYETLNDYTRSPALRTLKKRNVDQVNYHLRRDRVTF